MSSPYVSTLRKSTFDLERHTLPFPLYWQQAHATLGTRSACKKQLGLADSIAMLLWEPYFNDLIREVHFWTYAEDGTPVAAWVSPYLAVARRHHSSVTGHVRNLVPDRDLREWISKNEGEIWNLISWSLLFKFFRTLLAECAFSAFGNDESSVVRVAPTAIEKYAVSHADAALIMLFEENPGAFAAFAQVQGMARATTSAPVPAPPWDLDSL